MAKTKAKTKAKASKAKTRQPAARGAKPSRQKILALIQDVGRIASVMFDGELCHQIATELTFKWMRDFEPENPYSVGDNYDVEYEPFIAAKKTLLRLQRLAPPEIPLSCTLWRPVPTLPDRVTCLVLNNGPFRWQGFGTPHVPLTRDMKAVLTQGKSVLVDPEKTGVLTVLVPVRDSFKDVSGFIEVSASANPAPMVW